MQLFRGSFDVRHSNRFSQSWSAIAFATTRVPRQSNTHILMPRRRPFREHVTFISLQLPWSVNRTRCSAGRAEVASATLQYCWCTPTKLCTLNSVSLKPLKPSVITWLHFECSAPYRLNLHFQFLTFGHSPECPNVRNWKCRLALYGIV